MSWLEEGKDSFGGLEKTHQKKRKEEQKLVRRGVFVQKGFPPRCRKKILVTGALLLKGYGDCHRKNEEKT